MSNKCLLSIISKNTDKKNELWKTGGLINFQKPQLQSVSSSSKFCPFVFAVIYTFFSCFERLFLCLTKLGGSYHCLEFNKFCGTAPLNLHTYIKSFFLFINLFCTKGWQIPRRLSRFLTKSLKSRILAKQERRGK